MKWSRISRAWFVTIAFAMPFALVGSAVARDAYWQGDVSNNWNVAQNWFVVGAPGDGSFVPQFASSINARANIGTDNPIGALNSNLAPFGSPVISADLAAPKNEICGIYLGVRQQDFTVNPSVYVNSAPAAGTLVGALTISAGTLTNRVGTDNAATQSDGRIMVGVEGRGYLTMTGGTLIGTGLGVGGEIVNDALGTSQLSLSGSSTLTINGPSTLGRRLRIEGPNVNFNSQGNVALQATNTYTAAITSPTTHSPIKSDVNAFLGGQLAVEYSGAAPAIGAAWNLFDVGGGIAGSFTNVSADGDVQITGVPATQPGEAYRLRQTTSGPRRLLQLVHEALPVLRVNRDTGELSIRNPFNGSINLEGYEVRSGLGSLVSTYKGISGAPAGDSGWTKAPFNSANDLIEVKQVGSFNLLGTPSVTLGTGTPGRGFDKLAVGNGVANFGIDGEDLEFLFATPDGIHHGHIEYIGTKFENDLVLRINPTTGQAFIKNDSATTLKIDGYSILSSTGNMSGAGFTGLGVNWQTSSPTTANAITQTNLTGFTTLAPGAQLAIGDISATGFTTAETQAGLSIQYILAEGLTGSSAVGGDYNGNGVVDAADYTTWRDRLGQTFTLSNVNPVAATPGVVDQEDYDYWKAQFGMTAGAMPETTFRVGSVVFDASAGAGGGGLAGLAVPEPSAAWLLLSAIGSIAASGRRLRQHRTTDAPMQSDREHRGAKTMTRRISGGWTALAGLFVAACIAASAAAATQGIALTNGDFSQPGPAGEKVVAFGETGVPFAPTDPVVTLSSGQLAGGIPGWTFTGGSGIAASGETNVGVGNSLQGDGLPGDSGTEGGGNPGNEILLSTLDGRMYQSSSFSVVSLPATQKYLLTFDAHNIFTPTGTCHMSARLYYVDAGGNRQSIGSSLVINNLDAFQEYSIEFVGGSAELTPALGRPIGVEFDTVSRENDATVGESWAGIDDVILQITGTTRGDFNGDGMVNPTDYGILRDNLQEAHTYEFAGELTRDYLVDLNDFRAFKTIYDSLNGAGSFAAMVAAGVPEPSAAVMLFAGVSCSALLRTRRRRHQLRHRVGLLLMCSLAVASILASAAPSSAELLVYDPFLTGTPAPGQPQYSVGYLDPTAAAGGGQNPGHLGTDPNFFNGGWHRRTTGDAPRAAVQSTPGLFYLDPTGAQGGSAYIDRVNPGPEGSTNTGARIGRSLASAWGATDATYYVSWIVNFGSMLPDNLNGDMGYRALEFWDESTLGNSGDADIWVAYSAYNGPPPPRTPSVARMHLHAPGSDTIIPNAPNSFNEDGATHLVVVKYVLDDAAASDSISVFLDPISLTEPAIAGVSVGGLDLTIGTLGFAMYGSDAQPVMMVDELRIATTYADALPPLPVPGDTDGDDDVDLVDYNTIFNNLGRTGVTGGPGEGDVALDNGTQGSDGRVGLSDFWIWKRNEAIFGAGSGGSATAAVPEPSSLLMLLAALAWTAGRRRNR